jgi:hypothetical protein
MFTSADGSVWKKISASRLSAIEIWKGNRILDETHAMRICDSVKSITDLSLNPFRIVVVREDQRLARYIVDGQHRVSILKKYFTDPEAVDFDVVIIEKQCDTEAEIIEYFKIINMTKSIQWKEDPTLAANRYIEAFCKEFNTNPKKPIVKTGKTVKPFLSIDKLRDALVERHVVEWRTTPEEFASRCREINTQYLAEIDTTVPQNKRAKDLGFGLGLLEFNWI